MTDNRSALEWVIDQYQVSTDKRSGITSDANREDDPQYIVRPVGQVIRRHQCETRQRTRKSQIMVTAMAQSNSV